MIDLDLLYQQAQTHQKTHGCGAVPYEYYQKLYDFCSERNFVKILEIGTGMGFSSAVLATACPNSKIVTVEMNSEHVLVAKEFFESLSLNRQIVVVNDIAELALKEMTDDYDIIFFDGFQIHFEFLSHYERLLKPGGFLFLANTQLTSKTSDQFFTELENTDIWKRVDEFSDTLVYQKISHPSDII